MQFVMTPELEKARDTLVRGLAKRAADAILDQVCPKGTQLELPIDARQPMRRVVIESPLSPSNGYSIARNQDYARECVSDSLKRGEAPYASHLFYTQVLDDEIPDERTLGMEAGFLWGEAAQTVAVYTDQGFSRGMLEGILRAHRRGASIEFRSINQ